MGGCVEANIVFQLPALWSCSCIPAIPFEVSLSDMVTSAGAEVVVGLLRAIRVNCMANNQNKTIEILTVLS